MLIDLIDVGLFEEFLGLGYQVHITSSVFSELEGDEYAKPVSKCIKQKKMFLYNLTAANQTALEKVGLNAPKSSHPFVFKDRCSLKRLDKLLIIPVYRLPAFKHSTQRQTLDYLCIQPEKIKDIYKKEL